MKTGHQSNTIRLGGNGRNISPKWYAVGGGLIVLIIIVYALSSGDPVDIQNEEQKGCLDDAECGPARICAAGGCVILISSEHKGLWHQWIDAHLDPSVQWKPSPAAGERMPLDANCSVETGSQSAKNEGKTTILFKALVHEVGFGKTHIHQYLRFKGSVWIDTVRFWFPGLEKIENQRVCVSEHISDISLGSSQFRGALAAYIDAALVNAAPANSEAKAGMSIELDASPAEKQGVKEYSFDLDPVYMETAIYHSVVALPLGAEVLALNGPPPFQQRLLTGYIAYYWKHTKEASSVTVKYRLLSKESNRLDMTELNP